MTPFLSYICTIIFLLTMLAGAAAILAVIFSVAAFILNLFTKDEESRFEK